MAKERVIGRSSEIPPGEGRTFEVDGKRIAVFHARMGGFFATLADLEATVAERCRRLDAETIKPHTDFHWWPRPTTPH